MFTTVVTILNRFIFQDITIGVGNQALLPDTALPGPNSIGCREEQGTFESKRKLFVKREQFLKMVLKSAGNNFPVTPDTDADYDFDCRDILYYHLMYQSNLDIMMSDPTFSQVPTT